MKTGPGFYPEEIIFAVTDRCNLKCPHCFVSRNNRDLSLDDSLRFLKTCSNSTISRIGFSGGEPFLNLDFVLKISEFAVEEGFVFDRLMTNGLWWKTPEELKTNLKKLYNTGFDGKIGLSWDSFHKQTPEQIALFCNTVFEIWNDGSVIEIQSVISNESPKDEFERNLIDFAGILNCKIKKFIHKKTGEGTVFLQNSQVFIKIDRTPLSYKHDDLRSWTSKKWFKETFCKNSGQILYVHPDGKIAPCCGTGNENPALVIGNIKQTLKEVLEQAANNKVVEICFKTGLLQALKSEMKSGKTFPGKTQDPCALCSTLCSTTGTYRYNQ